MEVRIPFDKRTLLALGGYSLFYAAAVVGVVLALKRGVVPWPFKGTPDLFGSYRNILVYAPVAMVAMASLGWPAMAGISVWKSFAWRRFSTSFLVGFVVSAGCSAFMLATTRYRLKGMAFWPPALMLCLMNAFAEEVLYRLSFFRLLQQGGASVLISNICQSMLYAVVHLPIGGWRLAGYAFFYGLLLGWIAVENNSVLPCIACHFAIDIGYVAFPLLIV